jgi:signal transduction histidine kinase
MLTSLMAIDGKKPSPGREQTDESLRIERLKTDHALAEKPAVEDQADMLVRKARESADAVLTEARDKADEKLDERSSSVPRDSTIAKERVLEDEALRDERTVADESLRREREETARALSRLLPLERDKTDRYLLSERTTSDDALSNRDDFLGIVSHDLRNLLGGIVVGAELLSKMAPADEAGSKTRGVTERIQRYVARMNRLIGDLVDVSSIDAGRLALLPAPGDWALLLAESADLFQGPASAKGIALETEIAESPLVGEFDHDRMLQVLANLITNSIKFSSSGGRIRVCGERAGHELRFSVSDTGVGVPDDMLEAIFERFCQVSKGDRRGVGLGLYISRSIVEAHGGRIWAESKVGEGTKVCFAVPDAAGAG